MADISAGLLVVLLLILGAEFVNGWTDAPNAIATVVSTRVLSPPAAIIMATALNTIGAMSGTAVAYTIGNQVVQNDAVNLSAVGAAMVALILWSMLAWRFGLPTSESHALVSGLAGAGLAVAGPDVLLWEGWRKVLIGLLFSTFLGFGGGYVVLSVIFRTFRDAGRTKAVATFGKLQVLSAAFMAFSHGSNDGQKFIGVFTMALVLAGVLPGFHVSWWIILTCSIVMGVGTSVGGWRIIKTMGMHMVRLEPHQGFAAETGAAASIQLASFLGVPVSTTHTISTSIMGVGAARRLSAVRLKVVREIVSAWILTFPVCATLAWLVAFFWERIS
ncbi:MAG: inorganic phosphate transporter [Acidobacteria bacterium]|nr:inorganic phosphate transporter [Acidobacteriota bacterium]